MCYSLYYEFPFFNYTTGIRAQIKTSIKRNKKNRWCWSRSNLHRRSAREEKNKGKKMHQVSWKKSFVAKKKKKSIQKTKRSLKLQIFQCILACLIRAVWCNATLKKCTDLCINYASVIHGMGWVDRISVFHCS